jgi:hypothetical protein
MNVSTKRRISLILAVLGMLVLVLAMPGNGAAAKRKQTLGPLPLLAGQSPEYALAGDGDTTTVGSAPVNSSVPVISGEARQGTPFSASDGSWDNSPDSFTYQWRRCGSGGGNCLNISGASSNSYLPRVAYVSHTIRVVVTASNSYGSSSATSARTAVVLSKNAPPRSPASWNGVGCLGYNTSSLNFVCDYSVGSPFQITGSSKGGPSTVSYYVQCMKWILPPQKVVIYPRVWFKRSVKVRARFKIRGAKAALRAARHCPVSKRKLPVLTVTVKSGKGTYSTSLAIKLANNLPWGK